MFTESMQRVVDVQVNPMDRERVELVLKTLDHQGSWSKVYDGSLFLSMDAQTLDLLEPVPYPNEGRPRYRLKRTGLVAIEMLDRMHFVKAGE